MFDKQVLEIRQGVWIDQKWLHRAGLKNQLQVIIADGEIRLTPALDEAEEMQSATKGWDIFQSLGNNAQPGRLPNAAVEHDRYLYGKSKGE